MVARVAMRRDVPSANNLKMVEIKSLINAVTMTTMVTT
jgi:hypothetical protein